MNNDDLAAQKKFDSQTALLKSTLQLTIGDIYEDCAFHPVLCVGINYEKDEIWGISLIDGSYPRSCSLTHCGIRKLTPAEAWDIRRFGPVKEEDRVRIATEKRWWFHSRQDSDAPYQT